MNFYTLIIGSEILNRRRVDAHFDFVSNELIKYGYTLKGSFVIADEPDLIVSTLAYLKSISNSIVFSFGGIGSTPDDHTRQAAANALRDGELTENKEARNIIIEQLGERAFPHAINMAMLPKNSDIIDNPFNKMPAFSIDKRFYFTPGFPEMSHPMIETILKTTITNPIKIYRLSLTAFCRESELIETMKEMPSDVECSSLPKIYSDGSRVVLSVASKNKELAEKSFSKFTTMLDNKKIIYGLADENDDCKTTI